MGGTVGIISTYAIGKCSYVLHKVHNSAHICCIFAPQWRLIRIIIINGTQIYNCLILVIRLKFGFPLQVYSDVIIKLKLYGLIFA